MKALRACGETHHRRGRKYGGSRAGGEGRTPRLELSRPGVGSQAGAGGQLTADSSSSGPSSPSSARQSRSTRAVTRTENKTNIRPGQARLGRGGDNDVSVPASLTSQTTRAMDVRPIIINGLLGNNQPQWCILTNIHLVQPCKK